MPSRPRHLDSAASADPSSSSSLITNLAGQIMWLPRKKEISVETALRDGCYHHPVVILSPTPVNGKVVILMITSLQGQDLIQKYPHAAGKEMRARYIPIKPSKPHPDLSLRLKMEGGLKLRKDSHICIKDQLTIPFAALRAYEQQMPSTRYVLAAKSYRVLIDRAGYTAPVPPPQQNLANPPQQTTAKPSQPKAVPPVRPPDLQTGTRIIPQHEAVTSVSRTQQPPFHNPHRPPANPGPDINSDMETVLRYGCISLGPGGQSYGAIPTNNYRVPAARVPARDRNLPAPTPHTSHRGLEDRPLLNCYQLFIGLWIWGIVGWGLYTLGSYLSHAIGQIWGEGGKSVLGWVWSRSQVTS